MDTKLRRTPLTDSPKKMYDELEKELAKYESAWAKSALYFRTDLIEHFGHGARERRLQSLPEIQRRVEVFQRRYQEGDTLSFLQAIETCATENLPLPTWLYKAFSDALRKFLQPGGPRSLDSVFASKDIPTSTVEKAEASRQDWQLCHMIYSETWRLSHSDATITSFNNAITNALAKKRYGVGKTKVRTLFLMIEKNQLEYLGKDGSKSFSRFLAKRRTR